MLQLETGSWLTYSSSSRYVKPVVEPVAVPVPAAPAVLLQKYKGLWKLNAAHAKMRCYGVKLTDVAFFLLELLLKVLCGINEK